TPDLETWRVRARALRKAYRAQAGMPPVSKPLGVKTIGRVRLADCMREEFHVRTGPFTYANLVFLRPHGPARKRATILHLPGSGSDVAKVETQFAHEIVAQGWNAAIIDARVALYPFHPGIPEGMAMVNQSLHDLCCCLDYVAGREDVDAARIGTMGVSQGGTHSWMLAAMDERIAAAAPVCGTCTYRSVIEEWRTPWYDESMLSFLDSHSIYYFTPGVLRLADQQDLCGLIAPRPFMLLGGNHDNCFPLGGMRECNRDLRRLYKLFGQEDRFVYYEFEGPHSMPEHSRRAAYAFFKKMLKA
ncbi:MAG: prolyl oligopeptidase family serine peptidase, partial [Planctomycetota bacterium]|nr:prolyl oligopeptidase family serine peptidase [Planctomycetota bacterium]